METYSVLSQAAYTFNDNDGNVESTEREIEEYGLEGYTIDKELSDNESLVLFNEQGQEVTLAVRGTKPTSLTDLRADVQILLGEKGTTERFTGEFDKMNRIMEKYPDAKHVVTGHSLGGNISYKLARHFGVEGHHFNSGASIREARDNIISVLGCGFRESEACSTLEKQHFYSTRVDPISTMMMNRFVDNFGRQNVHYQFRPGIVEPVIGHSLAHFLPAKKGQVKNEVYKSHVEKFKHEQQLGLSQMVKEPRVKVNQKPIRVQDPDPVARDYCADNPNDPRCLRSSRLGYG